MARWRLRDASAVVRASAIFEVALDADVGDAVSLGVIPLAAGHAYGQHWAADDDANLEDVVLAYRRRTQVRVAYGTGTATIGTPVSLVTTAGSGQLTTKVEGTTGDLIATIEQQMATESLKNESIPGEHSDAGDLRDEDFTRVRVARWVYISGENPTVHGNHVAATDAGLPSAVVPTSLLLGLAERQLFAHRSPANSELTMDLHFPIFSGEIAGVETSAEGDYVRIRTARGIAAEAKVL